MYHGIVKKGATTCSWYLPSDSCNAQFAYCHTTVATSVDVSHCHSNPLISHRQSKCSHPCLQVSKHISVFVYSDAHTSFNFLSHISHQLFYKNSEELFCALWWDAFKSQCYDCTGLSSRWRSAISDWRWHCYRLNPNTNTQELGNIKCWMKGALEQCA